MRYSAILIIFICSICGNRLFGNNFETHSNNTQKTVQIVPFGGYQIGLRSTNMINLGICLDKELGEGSYEDFRYLHFGLSLNHNVSPWIGKFGVQCEVFYHNTYQSITWCTGLAFSSPLNNDITIRPHAGVILGTMLRITTGPNIKVWNEYGFDGVGFVSIAFVPAMLTRIAQRLE